MEGFRRSIAVVMGINAYGEEIPTLRSAVNDATALARLLNDKHRYDQVHLMLDGDVTHQALDRLLSETLPSLVDTDDRLLVYFAGHGIALNGDDGPQGFLLPHDARRDDSTTFFPMSSLNQG